MSEAPESANIKLDLRRTYDATPEELFSALTEPSALMQWFGPDDLTVVDVSVDPVAQGKWSIEMRSPGGERHCVRGEYRELRSPQRLVFTWAWESTPERISLVTVQLHAVGAQTELRLTHERFADEGAREGHLSGWTQSLEHLTAYLQS